MSLKDLLPSQWTGKPVIEGVVDAFDVAAGRLDAAVAQRVLEAQLGTASAAQIEEWRQLLGAPRVDFTSLSRAALLPSAVLSVAYANQTDLRISGAEITVQARLRVDELPGTGAAEQGIVSKWGATTVAQSFRLALVRDTGVWYLDARVIDAAANTTARRVAFDPALVGQWTRVAFRFDGAEVAGADRLVIFIDGAAVTSEEIANDATTLQDADELLYVGDHQAAGSFQGAVDMALVWAEARTDLQIAELGDPDVGSGAGYWTFSPTQAAPTADLSSNGQDLAVDGTLAFTSGPQATLVWAQRLIKAFGAAARSSGSIEAMYRMWRHATKDLDRTFLALHLDRSLAQYAQITDAEQTGLDGMAKLTVEARVRALEFEGTFSAIAGKHGSPRGYLLYLSGGAEPDLHLQISEDGVTDSHIDVAWEPSRFGVWTRIAAVFDPAGGPDIADRLKLYIDGVQQSPVSTTGPAPGAIFDNAFDFRIGMHGSSSNMPFNGDIRDVKVWGRALSDAEIALGTADTTELRGHWRLDGDYSDASPNGNTLTPVNGPSFVVGEVVPTLAAAIDTPFTAGEIAWNHDPIPREGDAFLDLAHRLALLAAVQAAAPTGAVVTAVEI